jgi:uncharacterized PurR-regulated membrane protein YhhQ (DUF165 family)
MTFSFLYLVAIVGINIGFEHVPMVLLPTGDMWPPMSLAVGMIFVLRDYAQREIGHRVLLLMLVGAVLSYVLATPAIAMASLAAYIVSETVDWALYTFARMDFRRRVLVSSLISAPVDSAVFLMAIGVHSPSAIVLMTVSKWIGIAALMLLQRRATA